MSKVSIIVPIYNVEKYVEKCLNSLLNQTFKDIEIWAVIDGSPDNSVDIVKRKRWLWLCIRICYWQYTN